MELLSGNEAIARGAWEAGAHIGVAYPGTPSTETMEVFARMPGVYAEWATNEKVAVEVGVGASAAGARVLVTMKHVGVNVAADPLFTAAYTGVGGGLVVLAADDPGMHSSQDEQDSRYYAMAAHIPLLEPADSAEARAFTRDAYDLSERFDVPFFIRSTVRISHAKCPTDVGPRTDVEKKPYAKDESKWVMMPAFARPRRVNLIERDEALRAWADECPYNVVEKRDARIGIVCSGATYQHVREALPDASVLKLGLSWPLPEKLLHEFAASVDDVYVIEEASAYLSDAVKAAGIVPSAPKRPLLRAGELTPGDIRVAFGAEVPAHIDAPEGIPGRPPALCPGCPHRPVFRELHRMRAIVTGDIGCYTLGALAPLSAMDTSLCMGASVSMSHGFELAMEGTKHRPVVAVIGDSTFAHSGLTSLISTVYNQGAGTVCILDNRTTAMTGRQGNPVNGVTLQNRPSRELDLMKLMEAIGIEDLQLVDPQDVKAVHEALVRATKAADALSVIVFKSPCVLLERAQREKYAIKPDCRGCKMCVQIGCPSISFDLSSNVASIDPALCVGCSQCAQVCPFSVIVKESEAR